ncbi:hypothetical protein CDF08_24295 [Salmonella enterica]|nr:hypothetical protein [Salmonella enterica]EAZ5969036.1 hypothetical protein [Salmonella enterica]EDL0224142.1 hypothetical protein [Salmonella enterica subsp. diarizonae]
MADINNVFTESSYKTFCELRASIDAMVFASYMIPDNDDGEAFAYVFRIISERAQSDLIAFFNSLKAPN